MNSNDAIVQPRPKVIVHCVHGTFPRGVWKQIWWNVRALIGWFRNGCKPVDTISLAPPPHPIPGKRYWFEVESQFKRAIAEELGTCSHHVQWERFLWSGNNSFEARRKASVELRSQLELFRRKYPEACQIVLAHSHGGTVTAAAVDMNESSDPLADGLMTLATPFVRLVLREPIDEQSELSFKAVVAVILPSLLLLMSPLLASDALLRGTGFVANWILLVLALIALGLRHVPLAAISFILTYISGGKALRSDIILLVPFIIFILPFVFKKWWWDHVVRFYCTIELVQDRPIHLPCPLLAIRAPNDEATLLIGLGQMTERFFHLSARLIRKVIVKLNEWPKWLEGTKWFYRVLRFFSPIAVLLVISFITSTVYDWIVGINVQAWYVKLLRGFFIAGSGVFLVPFFLILVWILPAFLLSLATGREAFLLPALTGIDVEPLPFASPENDMSLVIDVEVKQQLETSGLNHSLHEANAIRKRIAAWIRQYLPGKP